MSDIPADIVIYALVAAGLIFWLRSVLGTRHGDEPQRPNPFVTNDDQDSPPNTPIAGPEALENQLREEDIYDPFSDEAIAPDPIVRDELRQIGKKDRMFDPKQFLKNAEDAFVMIVEAFADGDKEFLEPLLSENVYESFKKEIDRRTEKGEFVQTEIHAIRKTEISGAKLDGKMAYVFVSIHAEETYAVKDENGNLIAGNPNRANEMNDIWVFGRDIKSRDPVWRVYETHDGAVEQDSLVPEAE